MYALIAVVVLAIGAMIGLASDGIGLIPALIGAFVVDILILILFAIMTFVIKAANEKNPKF